MSMVSREIEKLVKDWQRAKENARAVQRKWEAAEGEEIKAANALGKALAPDDVRVGEEISFWIRIDHNTERLYTVRCNDPGTFLISVRSDRTAAETGVRDVEVANS